MADHVANEATAAIELMRKHVGPVSDNLKPNVLAQRSLEELIRIRHEMTEIRKALQKMSER